jgi:hypothetical protein
MYLLGDPTLTISQSSTFGGGPPAFTVDAVAAGAAGAGKLALLVEQPEAARAITDTAKAARRLRLVLTIPVLSSFRPAECREYFKLFNWINRLYWQKKAKLSGEISAIKWIQYLNRMSKLNPRNRRVKH